MNGKDLHEALEYVGPDLIDMAETATFPSGFWKPLLTTAACMALLLGLGKLAVRQLPAAVPEIPQAVVPAEFPEVSDPQTLETETCDSVSPEERFYTWFPQIDRNSMASYIQSHPDVLKQGWDKLFIDESDPGRPETGIYTIQGDPILAVNAEHQILLIRVSGETYRGVLAIANDATRLRLAPSSQIGTDGETVGVIAETNNGILAINGSGFSDEDGIGNGGQLWGYAMCSGTEYNENQHLSDVYRRLEIDRDGQFRLAGTQEPIGDEVEHALEFGPALLKDSQILVDETCGYTGLHPRAVIGQGEQGQIMMLVIEGRMPDYSIGTDVIQCAKLLSRYGCQTALNLDGGTSAVLWYNGKTVTRCSNPQLPNGRALPTAFVYTTD